MEDCNPLMQCYHCQKYGHTAPRCLRINEKPICPHCAGDHGLKDCQNKNEVPKCINCTTNNQIKKSSYPTNHKANNEECKQRIKMLQYAKERIDYN